MEIAEIVTAINELTHAVEGVVVAVIGLGVLYFFTR